MIRCNDCIHFMHNICTCFAGAYCGNVVDENFTCKCATTKYVVGSMWNLTMPKLVDFQKKSTGREVYETRTCEVAGAYPHHVLFVDSKGIKHSYTYRDLEQMENNGKVKEVKR